MKIRVEKKEKKDKQWTKLTKPKVDYLEKIRLEVILRLIKKQRQKTVYQYQELKRECHYNF